MRKTKAELPMYATALQSAVSRIGKVNQAFMGPCCRKEAGDNAVILTCQGNLYKLEGLIGEGGLSSVFRASRFSDGMIVALKIADMQKSPEAANYLRREAALLATFDHPGIVKVIDNGTTIDGFPFIALEFLEGRTLAELLASEAALDLDRVSRICLQVACALQHAHEFGILHRDIKPANIMLVDRDDVEEAVILDFGVSLAAGRNGSAGSDGNSGSLLYASPEQLKDEMCSYRTDVYQLALVMFEALTGRLPFEVSVAGAINYRRQEGPVLLSDEELGGNSLPEPLRKVLEGALERNPEHRTQNMHSFIEEWNQALYLPPELSSSDSLSLLKWQN